jgi:hypothetical protein
MRPGVQIPVLPKIIKIKIKSKNISVLIGKQLLPWAPHHLFLTPVQILIN